MKGTPALPSASSVRQRSSSSLSPPLSPSRNSLGVGVAPLGDAGQLVLAVDVEPVRADLGGETDVVVREIALPHQYLHRRRRVPRERTATPGRPVVLPEAGRARRAAHPGRRPDRRCSGGGLAAGWWRKTLVLLLS